MGGGQWVIAVPFVVVLPARGIPRIASSAHAVDVMLFCPKRPGYR